MKDLFGNEVKGQEMPLSVYGEERVINSKVQMNRENWIYIALVIIPDTKKGALLNLLDNYRKLKDINYYHELKFHKLRKIGKVTKLARLWLNEIVNDHEKRFYVKILGIKKDNLIFEIFGADKSFSEKYANIYNRFFRTAFLSALNSFFPNEKYEKVTISGLFHDTQGILEAHDFFPWHLCYKLSDEHINFKSSQFCFVNSDHRIEPNYKDESQFIQLADLLIGSVSHCLDLPTQSNKAKNEVAKIVLPIIKRSRSEYFRKYDISFYPSKRLTLEEYSNDIERAKSHFFNKRCIPLEDYLSCQLQFIYK